MKLEKLVQKLDAANPWTVERVESVFDSKLALIRSNDVFMVYTAGPFHYEEGLVIEEVHLRLKADSNEMIRLIVRLSDDASCFAFDRIKKTYPHTQIGPLAGPRGQSLDEETHYWTKRLWGHISFGFKERRPSCLSSVVFIPKAWE